MNSEDIEWCDFTDALFFERRWLVSWFSSGITLLQELYVIANIVVGLIFSVLVSTFLIEPGWRAGVLFVLFGGALGGWRAIALGKQLDHLNRDLGKTQGQFWLDRRGTKRHGHYVNGWRRKDPKRPTSVALYRQSNIETHHREGRRAHVRANQGLDTVS